ncbi:hypothetical protein C2846_07045 [Pseudomonas jilinensis]|uniref:Uncharacterized protein n=2 Tax=Pseudomonas jilinensis TaxID=2078689 RepID=A0A396RYH3_9PSED|nr:hypothetical protein C2846_07045 [Pseudomonas jilinensis]
MPPSPAWVTLRTDMSCVRLLFTRNRLPGSWAIRLATWSCWSHVDLVDTGHDEPRLVGAVAPSGVVTMPMAERLKRSTHAALVEVPHPEPHKVLQAAYSQIGKGYDWAGIAGIALRQRDWESGDRWFCSELVAWAFNASGKRLFRCELVGRVTPQHLWMLANPYLTSSRPLDLMRALSL